VIRATMIAALVLAGLAGGLAAAQTSEPDDARALASAKREAEEAVRRSDQLDRESRAATDEATRARADASALAARIEAAEADITAAEARVRIIERLRAAQRARLAERQEPVVRLTAALQMMGRRPPALALVQPGSLHDLVHVRAVLASTLPIIRARTAALREDVAQGNLLRTQADRAVAALRSSREELKNRRVELARLEIEQRHRSQSLAESALFESDRALALGEEARELTAAMGTKEYQAQLRSELATLPGPLARPLPDAGAPGPDESAAFGARYRLPVGGRLVRGMGELSDGGVHARGLTFETAANAPVVAPASGRIVYAGRFRSYGNVVIIDHGRGWTSVITNLASMEVSAGQAVAGGTPLGRTGGAAPRVIVELRHGGHPVAIASLLG